MTEDVEPDQPATPHGFAPGEGACERVKHVSPGHILRSARERKGLSVDQVCAETLLGKGTIRALEYNQFDRLSQPVFARGYYRKCAKILDIPEAEIMAAYTEWAADPGPQPVMAEPVDAAPPREVGFDSQLVLGVGAVAVVVVLLLAIGLFSWFWLPGVMTAAPPGGGDTATVVGSGGAAADQGVDNGIEPAPNPAPVAPAVSPPLPSGTEQSTADNAVSGAGAAGTDNQAAVGTGNQAVAGSGDNLVVHFNRLTWVKVRDAGGAVLLQGIIQGGTDRELTGKPPYTVILGRADAVTIAIGGQPVHFAQQINANGTARFRVRADGTAR